MTDIRRQLRRLTVPIFLEIALVMLVGAVDTVMVSRYGDGAVAALGIDNQIISLVFLVFQFISLGVAIVGAQYHGGGQHKRFVQVVGLGIGLSLLVGLAFSAFLYFNSETLLRAIGLREEQMADGVSYLKITGAFAFFQSLSFVFSSSLYSAGRVKSQMVIAAFANVLNFIGNYALIFGNLGCPELGVAGAAWATAGSRAVGAVLLGIVHGRTHVRSFPLEWFRPFPWRELGNIFRIGVPAMAEQLSYTLSQVVVMYFINAISTEAIAARTYAANCIMFVYLFCLSATQAGDVVVGHFVGRRRYRSAYLTGNFFCNRSMLVTVVGSVLLALAGPWVFGKLTSNPEIVRLGAVVLWVDVVLEIGRVWNVFAGGTLRAAGDVVYPLVVGLVVQWSVGVGLALIFGIACGWGLVGMWIAFLLDENIRGVILMRRWHGRAWIGKSLC